MAHRQKSFDSSTSKPANNPGKTTTKSQIPATGWFRPERDGVSISIRLQPRAAVESIDPAVSGELRVRVTAPPVDSAANEALLRLLARELSVPRNRIELVRGGASRHKVVKVYGISANHVAARLNPGNQAGSGA